MKKQVFFVASIFLLLLLCTAFVFAGGATEKKGETFIGVVLHGPSPFTESIKRGAEVAGKNLGVKVEVSIPSNYEFEEQLSYFDNYIARGADGIIVLPYPEMSWVVPIKNAIKNGTPVFTVDITAPGVESTAHLGPDGFDDGLILADFLLKDLASKGISSGTIVNSICLAGVGTLEGRARGLVEGLKDSGFKVLGPLDSTFDQQSNYSFYETSYNGYPDMVAATGVCDVDGPSMAKHIEKTGAKYTGYAFDVMPEGLIGLQKGYLGACVGSHPYLYGYLGVQAFVEHFRDGKKLPQGWLKIGQELVTTEEADDVYRRETDTGYEEEWYNNWIEKNVKDINTMTQPMSDIQYLKYFE